MSTSKAQFAPSISHGYARTILEPQSKYRRGKWPAGLTSDDLDFLSPKSRLFTADAYLLSAGQYLNKRPDAYPVGANSSPAKVIGDSGGFQVIDDPDWYQGKPTVLDVLGWQERSCNAGLVLDIPTRAALAGNQRFNTYAKCLVTTRSNIEWAKAARTRSDFHLLNAAQGNDLRQALDWYDNLKDPELNGWGFGGETVVNLEILATLLVRMRDDGELSRAQWLHFLGTGMLDAGLAYTAIKRAIENVIGRELTVTFDCSNPFTNSYRHKTAIAYPRYDSKSIVAPSRPAPTSPNLSRSDLPFPYRHTTIGKMLTVGDVCVNGNIHADHGWDNLSCALVANHNFEALLLAFEQAHCLFDMPPDISSKSIPIWLMEFKDFIAEVLKSERAMSLIKKNRALLPVIQR